LACGVEVERVVDRGRRNYWNGVFRVEALTIDEILDLICIHV